MLLAARGWLGFLLAGPGSSRVHSSASPQDPGGGGASFWHFQRSLKKLTLQTRGCSLPSNSEQSGPENLHCFKVFTSTPNPLPPGPNPQKLPKAKSFSPGCGPQSVRTLFRDSLTPLEGEELEAIRAEGGTCSRPGCLVVSTWGAGPQAASRGCCGDVTSWVSSLGPFPRENFPGGLTRILCRILILPDMFRKLFN